MVAALPQDLDVGVSEQQWFFCSVGINVCESGVEALYCNMDNRVVSSLNGLDTIAIMHKSSAKNLVLHKYSTNINWAKVRTGSSKT